MAKINQENRRDIIAIFFAVPWQVVLFLTGMMIVLKQWTNFIILFGILIILSFGLYWFWFRHLSKEVKYEDINTNLLFLNIIIFSQQLDVTFRYVKEPNFFNRMFCTGTMPDGTSNDWGPNSNVISPSAPSQMIYNENNDSYEKSYSLQIRIFIQITLSL